MMPVLLSTIFPTFTLPQTSNFAGMFEHLYDFIFWISTVSFVVIVLLLVVFTHRYSRKRKGEVTPYIEGHTPTEAGVSIGLFILVMVIFYWGYIDYTKMRAMPSDALEINVMARQWAWEFQYPNGRKSAELVLPKARKVKMIMTSQDVIHSLFIPNFRVKQDIVPGMYTTVWFEPTAVGINDIFCAEYCGTAHSQMLAKVKVLEPADYDTWQLDWELQSLKGALEGALEGASASPAEAAPRPLAEQGKVLYEAKGCPACHSIDGSKKIGPSHWQLIGRVEEMTDGSRVTVDENNIRESIMEPQAKVVKGYDPIMPTYKGQLKDEEITALIEYLKSLK